MVKFYIEESQVSFFRLSKRTKGRGNSKVVKVFVVKIVDLLFFLFIFLFFSNFMDYGLFEDVEE